MKTSGNKVMIVLSAVILGSTLIVPVLPAAHSFFNNDVEEVEKNSIEIQEAFGTSDISFDFSIGRELSIRL